MGCVLLCQSHGPRQASALATFPIVVILLRAIFSDDEPKNNRISRTGTVSQYHRHSVFKLPSELCRAVLNGFLAHEEQSDNKTISMGRVTYNNIDMTNGLIGKAGLLLSPTARVHSPSFAFYVSLINVSAFHVRIRWSLRRLCIHILKGQRMILSTLCSCNVAYLF